MKRGEGKGGERGTHLLGFMEEDGG